MKLRISWLIFSLLCIGVFHLSAQSISFDRSYPPVTANGQNQAFAWAGGLNGPQLSAIDLDGNGVEDLYIFDRSGNKQLTFINQGTTNVPSYRFAPEYAAQFPQDLSDWVLLRDYDEDGIMDIFAYDGKIASGIKVYRGQYTNNTWTFTPFDFGNEANVAQFPPASGGVTQIYISNIDYPAVDDMDCDGDLDILTFNVVGGFTELYTNQSVELGYGRDSLIFELEDNCWGGFYETAISPEVLYGDAPGQCWDSLQDDDPPVAPRHPGSTLLTFDATGNGLKDLILGDIAFSSINLLYNNGTCEQAYVNDQTITYPQDNLPVDLQVFPAAFYLDVDNDGVRDLLAAPNESRAENYDCLWWYKNEGEDNSPDFKLQSRSFLVEDMIDLGTRSYPTPFDYNADGLMDLVVGSGFRFVPASSGDVRLLLYENVGTATAPAFNLVDEDYLEFNQYSNSTFNLAPTFGDIDGDGDVDALVGEQQGQMFFVENTAGPGNPAVFNAPIYGYMGIDIGVASTPFIVDLNRDGVLDLVIGERSGTVNYFENTGTKTDPFFDPNGVYERLGYIDTRVPQSTTGYSAPVVLDFSTGFSLLTGSRLGVIEEYQVTPVLTDTFPLIDPFVGGEREGERTALAFYDWDNDGFFEVIIGNGRGGLGYWGTNLTVDGLVNESEPIAEEFELRLSPNPTTDLLQIFWDVPAPIHARLFNGQGQVLANWQNQPSAFPISLSNFPTGLYYLELRVNETRVVRKVLKQ